MRQSLAFLALFCACADDAGIADGGVPCLTESCSNPEPDQYACQMVEDKSGHAPVPDILADLADPVASLILRRPGPCPETYADLVQKFRLEDRSGCRGGDRAGMTGFVVSERSQLLGRSDQDRVVVSRHCGSREAFEVFFALPPIDSHNPELPEHPAHVIAFDDAMDVFNFYTLDLAGEVPVWSYHGSSLDMIDGSPDTGRECAGCHSDGGLVMREIHAPWVHWESGATLTPGAQGIIDRFADLGSRGSGPELAALVRSGNRRLGESRLARFVDELNVDLHGGSLRPLLAPLFCSTSMNLASAAAADVYGFGSAVDRFPTGFFVDPAFGLDTEVPIDPFVYQMGLLETGSRIEGVAGAADTFFGFTFVTRAQFDVDFVATLVERGFIDEEFVLDVLSIDFTRPVYSPERCALLEFVPDFADLDETETPPAPPTTGDLPTPCCAPHDGGGCDEPLVETCVCDADAYCCDSRWDQACVNLAIETCEACEGIAVEPGLRARPAPHAAIPSPTTVRNAMYARLDASNPAPDSAAAQLRDALAERDQVDAHIARAERFVQACRDRAVHRDEAALVLDVLGVATRRKNDARERGGLLDTAEAVTMDDLRPDPEARLDPVTCELRP